MSFKQNEEDKAISLFRPTLCGWYGSAWRHILCRHDCPENLPHRKTIFGVEKESSLVLWVRPHSGCDTNYIPQHTSLPAVNSHDHDAMDLRVLRTSCRIYNEAGEMLGTTNTFSFDHSIAFERFMMTRNPQQKEGIRSLRLEISWNNGSVFAKDLTAWNHALNNSATVDTLSNLSTLRLQISDLINMRRIWDARQLEGAAPDRRSSSPFMSAYWSVALQVRGDGLLRFSTLPLLTHVEVGIRGFTDDGPSEWPEQDREGCGCLHQGDAAAAESGWMALHQGFFPESMK